MDRVLEDFQCVQSFNTDRIENGETDRWEATRKSRKLYSPTLQNIRNILKFVLLPYKFRPLGFSIGIFLFSFHLFKFCRECAAHVRPHF